MKRVANGCYCHLHRSQALIALYPEMMPEWPSSRSISDEVKRFDTVNKLVHCIESLYLRLQFNMRLFPEGVPRLIAQRRFVMTVLELLKVNAEVMYNVGAVEKLASVTVSKLDEFPSMAAYVEDFRRKCVKSHRDAAQKRLMSFYFKRCEDLCDDMIWEILQRV
jgi:hypothetical protein